MKANTTYYTFLPGYNDGVLEDPGSISADILLAVYDRLIAKRLPSCLYWCGDEVIGPREPDEEEQAELDAFPGFDVIQEQAWGEFCFMSDEDIMKVYEEG